jgi:hypothetical protein
VKLYPFECILLNRTLTIGAVSWYPYAERCAIYDDLAVNTLSLSSPPGVDPSGSTGDPARQTLLYSGKINKKKNIVSQFAFFPSARVASRDCIVR